MDEHKGDNMSPKTYDDCFAETTATIKLEKWTYVFEICSLVAFFLGLIFLIGFMIGDSVSLSTGGFLLYLIVLFFYFLFHKLTCAVLNSIAQISHNTGISAKLAAFNTRNQMMKDASKEKEN